MFQFNCEICIIAFT